MEGLSLVSGDRLPHRLRVFASGTVQTRAHEKHESKPLCAHAHSVLGGDGHREARLPVVVPHRRPGMLCHPRWDVSAVTSMNSLFQDNTAFNQDVDAWDVAAVIHMNNIFNGATAFNQNLSSWNVQNVVWWINAFKSTSSFNKDLSAWGTISGNCNSMFSGSAMNQDLSPWDISGVTSMQWMFSFSSFDQDLGWSVSSSVSISNIAKSSPCEETNCGVVQLGDPSPLPSPSPTSLPSAVPSATPTITPTSVPSPEPSPSCRTGKDIYRVHLTDSGGDGWQAATYQIADSVSGSEFGEGAVIANGTLSDGTEGFEWLCLAVRYHPCIRLNSTTHVKSVRAIDLFLSYSMIRTVAMSFQRAGVRPTWKSGSD